MTVYVVLKLAQQSNGRGTDDAGTAISAAAPYPAVRYWRRLLGDEFDSDAFGDLDTLTDNSYGDELAIGKAFLARGLNTAIIKVVKGATAMNQWVPGQPNNDDMIAELQAAIALLPAEFPGHPIAYAGLEIDQGELEMRHAADSVKINWLGFCNQMIASVEAVTGPLRRYVQLTRFELDGAVNPTLYRSVQLSVPRAKFIYRDGLPVLGDGVHDTSETQNIKGALAANLMLADLLPSRSAGNPRFGRRPGRRK